MTDSAPVAESATTPAPAHTPETDAFYAAHADTLDTAGDALFARELGDLARKLERERDEAREMVSDHAQDCETLARYIRPSAPKCVREIADNWRGDGEKP